MKGEIYLWIVFFVVVLAVAFYLRFYSSGQIGLVTGFAGNALSYQNVYPYQRVVVIAYINNTGSVAISDLGVEELINGNIVNAYGVTVPSGKVASIPINYTPVQNGTYNITVIADPNKLYNIGDRKSASASVSLVVNEPQMPDAYTLLPPGNTTGNGDINLNTVGFLYYSYLSSGYNLTQFNITGMPGLNGFLTPLIDVVGAYVDNISVAHAEYSNGSSVYAIWLRGYLLPDLIAVGAEGRNLTMQNFSVGGNEVTLVHLIDNESLCSWYSEGWLKTVSAPGNESCLGYVQNDYSAFAPAEVRGMAVPTLSSDIIVANDSVVIGKNASSGYTVLMGNQSIVYSGVATGNNVGSACYGVITTENGISYCSTYIFPSNQIIGPTSLVRTSEVINGLNATTLAIVNTSDVLQEIQLNIYLLKVLNLSGPSLQFVNGIRPTCGITGFGCENTTFDNGTVSFRLLNYNTSLIRLNSVGCVLNGVSVPVVLNKTVAGLGIVNISAPCYNEGQVETGLPYGLIFTLMLNYTASNTIHNAIGNVYVLG